MKPNLIALIFLLLAQACTHIPVEKNLNKAAIDLSFSERNELYAHIAAIIKQTNAKHLKECNCMKAFYRELFGPVRDTSRYVFDNMVGTQAVSISTGQDHARVFSLLAPEPCSMSLRHSPTCWREDKA